VIEPLTAERVGWLEREWTRVGGSKSAGYFQGCWQAQEGVDLVLWVARSGETLHGYIKLARTSPYPPFAEGRLPEVQDLNVAPASQRRGIGSALMDVAEAAAAKAAPAVGIAVGLHSGYGPAQKLYGLRGYVPDGQPLQYHDEAVEEGQAVRLDDSLVMHLTKRLW